MDIAMGYHKGSPQWVTDIVIVHHNLMDTDAAIDHPVGTDTAMDLRADTDTAMHLLVHMVTVIPPLMDMDIVTSTVPVHLPLIVTTPSTDILMVIFTKNL